MREIKVKCPAKINLTLEILDKRDDGFHNIQSIMQTIDLFDILTIKAEKSEKFEISLSGTDSNIPYDEKNLVYKAIIAFIERTNLSAYKISAHIEKNIPIAAGLAGGSTDAAGTFYALNELFENILSKNDLHELCASLGSDLNFCLEGGCQLATGRGEILKNMPFNEFNLALIKPKNLGISAKEAYTKFSELSARPNLDMTAKMIAELNEDSPKIEKYLHNDLEIALIQDYKQLAQIKEACTNAIMSGSGSTFFQLNENIEFAHENYWVKNSLKSIPYGVCKLK